jgi:hypothetical protein
MGRFDGGNYEAQTPFAMPQAQQRRGLEMQNGEMSQADIQRAVRQMRAQGIREVPQTIYPPQTEQQLLANQPMLDSDAMSRRMAEYANQQAGLGYVDPVSGSNDQNFATIGLHYTYCLDQAVNGFIELAPGASASFSINFTADSDFICQAYMARSTREFTFTLTDSGADRQLQLRPVSAIAFFGGTGRAIAPTVPQLYKGKTTVQIQLTDGGDRSPNIYNGNQVANANLEPSVANPQVLVNKIGLFLVGVKRLQRG